MAHSMAVLLRLIWGHKMITFTRPQNLNGYELRQELRIAGVEISDSIQSVSLLDDNLFLEIQESDREKADQVVAAHNGTTIAPDKAAEKQAILDRLGLTADEAALLLGAK